MGEWIVFKKMAFRPIGSVAPPLSAADLSAFSFLRRMPIAHPTRAGHLGVMLSGEAAIRARTVLDPLKDLNETVKQAGWCL